VFYVLFVGVGGGFWMYWASSYGGNNVFFFLMFLFWIAICYIVWLVKNIIVARIFMQILKQTLYQQPKYEQPLNNPPPYQRYPDQTTRFN
jgi:hypothetical protein